MLVNVTSGIKSDPLHIINLHHGIMYPLLMQRFTSRQKDDMRVSGSHASVGYVVVGVGFVGEPSTKNYNKL